MKRLLAVLFVFAALAAIFQVARMELFDRWGATDQELVAVLPGDEIVPRPASQQTHAITIHAPIEEVWGWVAQTGQDRAGFYSYEILEDLAGCRMPWADRVHPELGQWKMGDSLWMFPREKLNGFGGAPLRTLVPGRALAFGTWQNSTSHDEPNDGSWAFVLRPIDSSTTRFLVRGRAAGGEPFLSRAFTFLVFDPMHFTMERKQMETVKARAEGGPATRTADVIEPACWAVALLLFLVSLVRVFRAETWWPSLLVLMASGLALMGLPFLQPGALVAAAVVALLGAATLASPRRRGAALREAHA